MPRPFGEPSLSGLRSSPTTAQEGYGGMPHHMEQGEAEEDRVSHDPKQTAKHKFELVIGQRNSVFLWEPRASDVDDLQIVQ
jgi:hypothetical protein